MELTARIRAYLFDALVPMSMRFIDKTHGGFHEQLESDLSPSPLGYKRLVVQCRQIYFFSHVWLLGGGDECRETAARGFEFLRESFWDQENGGWFFKVTPEGEPLDQKKDCYAHAFVLLSLSFLHRASGDSLVLEALEETLDLLEHRFTEHSHGGYIEFTSADWRRAPAIRRQNPHMHMMEAMLGLHEMNRGERPLLHARRILGLFRAYFFDEMTGTLGEYFTDDWRPHPEMGDRIEPGHHFEWSWLLTWYARITSEKVAFRLADRLIEWGMKHGYDWQRGGIFDELSRSGEVKKETKRIWPIMEAIKACAVRYQRVRDDQDHDTLAELLEFLFARYLHDDGRWNESLEADGQPRTDVLPGSTTYHLLSGLSEALRVLEGSSPSTWTRRKDQPKVTTNATTEATTTATTKATTEATTEATTKVELREKLELRGSEPLANLATLLPPSPHR